MRKLLPSVLTLLMLSAVGSQVHSQPARSSQTFTSFWAAFKAAVAKGDKEAVATMTKFPFPWGEEMLTKDKFLRKYNEIFNQRIQRCLARAKPVNDYQAYLADAELARKASAPPPQKPQDTSGYSVGCGERIYLFALVAGKYKFTEIGVND
jgi:hypothetical protein